MNSAYEVSGDHSFKLPPENIAASCHCFVDGIDNAILGNSDHSGIYHGEGSTILNSPKTQLYHSHHVIIEGVEGVNLHSLSYVHVTPAGHAPLNEQDWRRETERVRNWSPNTWQLWTEGYSITGGEANARFHGEFPGETFEEAVANYKGSLDQAEADLIDLKRMTYWGCRFFSSESQARKSFG